MTNSKSATSLVEQLKNAEPEKQLKYCVRLALDGDWQTVKAIGGNALVTKTAKAIESAKEKVMTDEN